MTPAQYLDAAKAALKITSDYELAKRLDLRAEHMGELRSGKRAIPPHAALRLAITLRTDPACVMIDLIAQRETKESRLDLYRSFLSRACKVLAIIACTLALISSGGHGPDRAALGGFKRRPCCA